MSDKKRAPDLTVEQARQAFLNANSILNDKKNWRLGNRNAAKSADEKLTAHLRTDLTPAQKNGAVKAAQDEGMTLGAWVRRLINRELKND